MSDPAQGRLKVHMAGFEDLRAPFKLIDSVDLHLVRTATCEEEIPLEAGSYVVTATAPSGERATNVVEVAAGELNEVELRPPQAAAVSSEPELIMPWAPTFSVGRSFFLRFLSMRGEDVRPVQPHVERIDPELEPQPDELAQLVVSAVDESSVLFAQVATTFEVPLSVALPIVRYGVERCRMTVSLVGNRVDATVSLPDDPRLDAVARYLREGNLLDAATIVTNAKELLFEKVSNPFAAALGGYALLRLGRLELMHDWPENLSEWFPWLPDGAVVAAERAALTGDHREAVERFLDAARRGLPVYADGFSILVSRLREYGRDGPAGVSSELLAEVKHQADRLAPAAPFVDFSRIVLAIRAARLEQPAESQEPLSSFQSDGWGRFDEFP